ncbi:hypothetical protein LTR53_016719 [Teratosphaeriaceae sp. CCFEE 6253]|nr:hypothetical protein LTR53_016719 [Teratosphaeriaceae sp. CCFEE 6253]
MQDKPLHQQNLAQDLADLMDVLKGDENMLGWLRGFWVTMGREWGGIDGLRMDKFLYLGFEVCGKKGWEEDFVERYSEVLAEVPFNVRDHKIPDGLRYHVLDLYMDELEKADPHHKAPVVGKLLGPVKALEKDSLNKKVRERVRECLADERLAEWSGGAAKEGIEAHRNAANMGRGEHEAANGAVPDEDDDEFGGFDD